MIGNTTESGHVPIPVLTLEASQNATADDVVYVDLSTPYERGDIADAVSGFVAALFDMALSLGRHAEALVHEPSDQVVLRFADDDGKPIRMTLSRPEAIGTLAERARRFEDVAWELHDLGERARGSEVDRGVGRLRTVLRQAARQLRGHGPSRLDISEALLLELQSFEAWEHRLDRDADHRAWIGKVVQRLSRLLAVAATRVEFVRHGSPRESPIPSSGFQLAHLLVAAPSAPPSAPSTRPFPGGVVHSNR